MKSRKYEKRVLICTYLLCIALFVNLGLLGEEGFDKNALVMAGALIGVLFIAQLVLRKFFPDGDKFLLTFSSVLSMIGIAVLYRIDKSLAVKQLIWVIAGIIGFMLIVIILPDFKKFIRFKNLFLGTTLVFMPMALIFGEVRYGAQNWVNLGFISFQPSEFGKIALILYLASVLSTYEDRGSMRDDFKQLWKPALVACFSLGCLVLQADLGSALIFFSISVAMLYATTNKRRYVGATFGLSAIGATVAYNLFAHVQRRVLIWRDPWKYANDESYQIVQGLYAIASGGLLGVGLGKGLVEYIPVKESDYIFAVISEELGIIFGLGIMIIYFLLFYRGIRAAYVAENRFAQLTAVGLSTMIACQTLVIIGGLFTIIPLTGITLPLVSYGGTSVLSIFASLGILQKVSEEGLR